MKINDLNHIQAIEIGEEIQGAGVVINPEIISEKIDFSVASIMKNIDGLLQNINQDISDLPIPTSMAKPLISTQINLSNTLSGISIKISSKK